MNRTKRMLAVLLALILMLGLLPFGAFAQQELASSSAVYINPAYADVLDESDIPQPGARKAAGQTAAAYTTIEEAALDVREQLKNRTETVVVSLSTAVRDDDYYFDTVYEEIYNLAVAHTGVPTEGDSLAWEVGGYGVQMALRGSGGVYTYTYTYSVAHYTTLAQEQEMDALVAATLSSLSLDGMTREQKIRAIYSFVSHHVTYDEANLNNASYTLKYTAYAALANGTAVCQGYALLVYRLMLEAGIDCRFIGGTGNGGGHGWNIVKLGGTYYCEDATWDSEYVSHGYAHRYELKGLSNFGDHERDPEYTDETFTSAFPTSDSDYVSGSAMDQDGLTYIVDNGSAIVTESDVFRSGAAEIPAELGGAPVSAIGFGAFNRCSGLTSVSIPATVTAVDDYAFSGCSALTDVWFGGTEAEWDQIAVDSHNEPLLNAAIHYAEPSVCVHDELILSGAAEPTCTESGYTGDLVCAACGETIESGSSVPALGHSWDEGVVTQQPTGSAEGVKTFTCTACGETRTEAIPKLINPFRDVVDSKFYHDAVLWAVSQEPQITSGYADGTFRPDNTCPRAQVVTFLWRASGCPEPETAVNPFHDVKPTDYYYKAVLWALENNVTTGKNATTFDPTGECTRAQVVTFLWRSEDTPTPGSTANPFTDVPGGKYYAEAVLWALEQGITTGKTATTFNPDGVCTRGHVVTFLYRDMA